MILPSADTAALRELAERHPTHGVTPATWQAVLALLDDLEALKLQHVKFREHFRHMDPDLTNTPYADVTDEMIARGAWATYRQLDDARMAAESQVEALTAERDAAVDFAHAILEDRRTADGQWPHLLCCNFNSERLGDAFCNCPIGQRLQEPR